MKFFFKIFSYLIISTLFFSCSGSRKYFKAGERLEEKGLVNEAAEYYLISLQKNPSNIDARIKLSQTGEKYIKFLSNGFFRSFNLYQDEEALEYFEKYKLFKASCDYLEVNLKNYNPEIERENSIVVARFSEKNYAQGEKLVKQKKYSEALRYLRKVQKYNPEYKKLQVYTKTSVCEPIYANAIKNIDNKNYKIALKQLKTVLDSSSNSYKDAKEIYDLYSEMDTKYVFLFPSNNLQYSEINDNLFNGFSQV
ncbi:MAG: tetratricopeptide repeat protein, partial [Bacteroidota bacterium]